MAASKGGAWTARQRQAGSMIWGTGINPIHYQRVGEGRSTIPNPPNLLPNPVFEEVGIQGAEYGFTPDDFDLIQGFGYDTDTGTADRANWDERENRGNAGNYPRYQSDGVGKGIYSTTDAENIRAADHGSERTVRQKVDPKHDAAQGWLNKVHGVEGLAKPSDPSQYEMTTSMTQRNKVREGSQVPNGGRASTYVQPIESRVVEQKVKTYVADDSPRHDEMARAFQDVVIRGFWNRGAGTGPEEWVGDSANQDYRNVPYTRVPPSDPNQGVEVIGQQYDLPDDGWYY